MNRGRISYRSPSYYEVATENKRSWRNFRDETYWEYRRLWEERPLKMDPGDFPLHVDVDTTNACNLRCTMCPRTHYLDTGRTAWAPKGKIGFIDFKLYQKIIDQAADGGAYSIKINWLGEPLLHPEVIEQVHYAHQRGLEVMMNTNATLLNREMSERLLEAGLADVFFSVDSPYPEVYEQTRVGARFEQVLGHIRTFIETQQRLGLYHVQTRVSMVIDPCRPEIEKEKEDFKRLFLDLGLAEIGYGLLTDMKVDYRQEYGRIEGFVCRDIFHRLFVFLDGEIGPCCGHWERGFRLGNIKTDTLKNIWHNRSYQVLRETHAGGRYDRIPMCRACSVPWLSRQEI
ncbi:MAG: radical SAM protein [Pseudomonadota bacterium]